MKRFWLMKTEPGTFSFDDLVRKGSTGWDGVRNYQARNMLRDEVQPGDRVLVYHSGDAKAVVGEAEVVRGGHPDPTQFDAKDDHYDPAARPEAPTWFQVEVRALRPLRPVTLEAMKREPALRGLALLRRGNRLSVQPVSAEHYRRIVKMATAPG